MFSVPTGRSRQAIFGLPRGPGRITMSYYDQMVLATPGLTRYWPFRNGSMLDIVGNLPLLITGTVKPAAALARALGTSMDNTGSGYMKAGASTTLTSPLSMECWVTTPNTTTEGGIMGAWGGGTGAMLIILTGSNQLKLYTDGSNNVVGTLSINTVYHIVGTYDGTNQRAYINGSLVLGPVAASTPAGTGAPFELGGYSNHGGAGMVGKYSNVAVYGRALSDAEVLAHYTAGVS